MNFPLENLCIYERHNTQKSIKSIRRFFYNLWYLSKMMFLGVAEQVFYSALINVFGGSNTDDSSVKLYFSKSPDYFMVPINRTDTSLIDPSEKLYIVVHGFNERSNTEAYIDLTKALIGTGVNVVGVDWAALAKGMNYFKSTNNIPIVVNVVAKYILLNGLNPAKITIVGFSLGAHIAGLVGKAVKNATHLVDKIMGLDPAGPLFGALEPVPAKRRLDKADARLVVTVMSNKLVFGTRFGLGAVNFIANNGMIQPGCFLHEFPPFLCSHKMALRYYTYSMKTRDFVGRNQETGRELILGNDIPYDAEGTYHFDTTSDPPYARG